MKCPIPSEALQHSSHDCHLQNALKLFLYMRKTSASFSHPGYSPDIRIVSFVLSCVTQKCQIFRKIRSFPNTPRDRYVTIITQTKSFPSFQNYVLLYIKAFLSPQMQTSNFEFFEKKFKSSVFDRINRIYKDNFCYEFHEFTLIPNFLVLFL